MARRTLGGACGLLLLAAAGATAQEPDTIPAGDTVPGDAPIPVEPIRVEATRPTITAGGASTVELNVDSVAAPASPTLSEVLRKMPLVRVRQNSRGQVQPSIRGVEERQISVQVDGIPITLGWDNRTDLSVVPMTAARRASLVRGLSSVVDGPNVLGAVVEIDVADAEIPGSAPPVFRGRVAADHVGAVSTSAEVTRVWRGPDDAFLLRVGGGARRTPGDVLASGVDQPAGAGEFLLNSDRDYGNAFVAGRWEDGSGVWVSLSSLAFVTQRGVTPELHLIGSDTATPRFWRIPNHWRSTSVLSAGTGEGKTPLGTGALEAKVGLDVQHLEIDSFEGLAFRDSVGGETGNDRNVTLRVLGDHTLLAGRIRGSVTLSDVWHEQVLPSGSSTFEQRLASVGMEVEQRLDVEGGFFGEPSLTVGGSWDASDTPETGGFPEQPGITGWGRRAAAGIGVFGGAARVHGGYSRKVRFPALRELYSGALGKFEPNPDLGPETLELVEAGVTARPAGQEIQLTFFDQSLEGSIVRAVLPDGQFRRENRGETRSRGAEMVATLRWGDHSVRADLTVQDVELADAEPGERAEYQPEVVGSVQAASPLPWGVRGRAEVEYTGEQFGANPRTGEFERLDPSVYLELALSRRIVDLVGGLGPLEAELAVTNITDEAIFDQLGLPRPGRTWQLRFRAF